jgi:pimeloyl-ACP methyl ester carboxylesterase
MLRLRSPRMPVYFAHATSFCGAVWRPVIEGLPDVEPVTWDFAGHGSGPGLEPPFEWSIFGEQVLTETEPGGVGVGHSMGAAALVMAQLSDPRRFRFMVLIEPVVFPAPYARFERDHMAAIALKRKRTFGSRDEALENFASRPAFAGWDRRALEGYVDGGLVEVGGGVALACSPEVEAEIYRSSRAHETWEKLDQIEIPVLVISGAESNTIPPDLARAQAARFRSAGLEIVPGVGHFLPMERPDLVAERVRRVWESVGEGLG